MRITKETYDKVMDGINEKYKDSPEEYRILKLTGDFIEEHIKDQEILAMIILNGLVNINMVKGFLLAWKICSEEVQSSELTKLERMMGTGESTK